MTKSTTNYPNSLKRKQISLDPTRNETTRNTIIQNQLPSRTVHGYPLSWGRARACRKGHMTWTPRIPLPRKNRFVRNLLNRLIELQFSHFQHYGERGTCFHDDMFMHRAHSNRETISGTKTMVIHPWHCQPITTTRRTKPLRGGWPESPTQKLPYDIWMLPLALCVKHPPLTSAYTHTTSSCLLLTECLFHSHHKYYESIIIQWVIDW